MSSSTSDGGASAVSAAQRDGVVVSGVYVDRVRVPGHFSPADAVAEVRAAAPGSCGSAVRARRGALRDVAEAFG